MKSRNDVKEMSANELVSWFMIAGYAYYSLGKRVMSDASFDYLVKRLKERWDDADHMHKSLINQGHLDATTGYDIKYPTIVKHCAHNYLKRVK